MSKSLILKFQVKNFRNLEEKCVNFSKGINLVFGNNGNGKTNLLESIYYLFKKKSFRKNTSFPQLLSIDCEKSELIFSSLFVDSKNKERSYSAKIENSGGCYFLDNKPQKRRPEIDFVFVNPYDSYRFFQENSFRKKWFDDHISALDKEYSKSLKKYNHGLRLRNKLLQTRSENYIEQINAIDDELVQNIYKIIKKRVLFLTEIKDYLSKAFFELFSNENSIDFQIKSTFISMTPEEIRRFLKKQLEKDVLTGHSNYGIHKDDFIPFFDSFNAFEFCSLGQQKMYYLSLLFAYIELFRYKYNTYPVVLIDDVSGELDRTRWIKLITYIKEKNFQVLITTANSNFRDEINKFNDILEIVVEMGHFSK